MDHFNVGLLFFACLFLLGLSAVDHYFRSSVIPPVCWMMLAGVAYGAAEKYGNIGLPLFQINPGLVFFVFLPVLIFDSSRKLHLTQLRSVWIETTLFATAGVVTSMVLVGLLFAYIVNIPVLDALLFGAVLSATDPVAVSVVFHKFHFPERLRTLIEGESLLNDGTTVILFSLLGSAIFGGRVFSAYGTVLEVITVISGAIALGVAMGCSEWALANLWHELHDRFIGALLPLITVYITFSIAEHLLHVSGVVAVMVATLTLTTLHFKTGHREREKQSIDLFFDRFWDFLNDLTNGVLFFLLGVSLGTHDFNVPWYALPAATFLLLAARSVVVYLGSGLFLVMGRRLPGPWQHILNIAGLKGALSVALILLMPHDYQYRELFLCTAFAVILFSLLANSVAMNGYLREKEFGDR